MYTYYYDRTRKYARRHRTLDGTDYLITRYTYGYHWQTRGVQGPRGGKARKERKYDIYYRQGMFYKAANIANEDGTYTNGVAPFEGWLHDCFPVASRSQGVPIVTIEVVEGIPVSILDSNDTEVWHYFDNSMEELEDLLWIPERDRAVSEPMATTYDATEEAEQLDQLIEEDQFGTDEYEAACDAYDERTEQISAAIVQTATESGAVRIEQRGTTYYLHRSTRFDGLQLTAWDERGPMGHYDVSDGGDLSQYIDYQRGPVTVTAA